MCKPRSRLLRLLSFLLERGESEGRIKMDVHANEIAIGLDLEDPNLEPQPRARSNTWPLRPNREVEPQNSPVAAGETSHGVDPQNAKDPLGLTAKKSGSRRNAWGNLSYADLITKAISSSTDKRLTLSQIYDWMVQNVPYFKDKGDSTSSAGWKVGIQLTHLLDSARLERCQCFDFYTPPPFCPGSWFGRPGNTIIWPCRPYKTYFFLLIPIFCIELLISHPFIIHIRFSTNYCR